jgi:hypothetical protein
MEVSAPLGIGIVLPYASTRSLGFPGSDTANPVLDDSLILMSFKLSLII